MIALAAHGTAWLNGITTGPPPRLEADNSTFQYVRRVRFELRRSSSEPATTASDVGAWLQDARQREIDRYWLTIRNPRVGEGQWFLLATSRQRSREVWEASWTIGDREAADRRIWDVEYQGGPVVEELVSPHPNIGASAQRLLVALKETEAFARDQQLDGWADWFADAQRLAEAEDPQPPYHADMLPALGFANPARRLLAVATRAWVFGGMGSWSDLSLEAGEDEDEYSRLSARLYSAVLAAFVAVVNTEPDA